MNLNEFIIPDNIFSQIQDVSFLANQLKKSGSIQALCGFSNNTMEKFYKAAKRLFESGQYDKSADAFFFLSSVNPKVFNFWLGLGMSEQAKGDYGNALTAYSMAAIIDEANPTPHIWSAECYLRQGDKENSLRSYELALFLSTDEELSALIRKSIAALS